MTRVRVGLVGLVSLLTAFAAAADGPPGPPGSDADDARVAWLHDNAVRLASIDPGHDDFRDLQPLRKALGDARIVQLGEQSHGDGATFLAKTRLVRFLHEEMGFDVIAFESGFYDCRKAWERFRAGDDPHDAARQGIFAIWTRSEQVRPIIEYIGARAGADRPLELCGFDCQFTAAASRTTLQDDLQAFFAAQEHPAVNPAVCGVVIEMIRKLALVGKGVTERECDAWRAAVETVRAALAIDAMTPEVSYWRQFLKSALAYAEVLRTTGDPAAGATLAQQFNPRDAQMADNMLWLARERYPDRKIIVWAATMHVQRSPHVIATGMPTVDYTGVEPMGHLLSQELGSAVFTIGFTAYEGRAGLPGDAPWPVPPAPAGSLEDLCVQAGLENAFIDLRGVAQDSFLRGELSSRPLGHANMRANWTAVLDGMVFTRTMTPSTSRR